MIHSVRSWHRAIAAALLTLLAPAALFMTALVVRAIQPQQYEPAHSAQLIVMWFAARRWTLLLLLIALPLAALAMGCGTIVREWRADAGLPRAAHDALTALRARWETTLIALATMAAAGILAVVAAHMLMD